MSKTNEMYLDKARSLTKGLRKHLVTVKNYGVSATELNEIIPNTNRKLAEIRNLTVYLKGLIKPRVDSSHWPEYGIADKR